MCIVLYKEKHLVVYALSGVGREVLKRYYIEKEMSLVGERFSPEEMAEWLSVMYYRGLFATNPPKGSLRFADKVLNIQKYTLLLLNNCLKSRQ